jgi:hypothetical protein
MVLRRFAKNRLDLRSQSLVGVPTNAFHVDQSLQRIARRRGNHDAGHFRNER